MNNASLPSAVRRCLTAALFLLPAALPAPSLAQKSAAPKPAASPPASAASLGLSPQEALRQKQMLADDKRLDRFISLDVISVPLDEVLQQVSIKPATEKSKDAKPSADTKPTTDAKPSADTKPSAAEKTNSDKILLTASHNTADLKLQIRLNQRPLRVLMQALSDLLPGKWTKTDDGYNLSLTDKAAVARAEWWRLFLGERDKALALQRQAMLSAMQTKARRRQANDPEPEPSDHAIEEEQANQHDFFTTLPQALKEQIVATLDDSAFYEIGNVRFSNTGERFGTIGWLSQMPPETQEKFKAAMQDYITNHLAGAPPAFQKYAQQAQSGLTALDSSKVYFLFQNWGVWVAATPFNGPPSSSTLDLSIPPTVNTMPLLADQKGLAQVVYGGADMPPSWKRQIAELRQTGTSLPPFLQMQVYQVYGMGDAAPQTWKQLADYQRGRVWPNTLPKLPRDNGEMPLIVVSRAAQTDWLGERSGMEYVCDYYSKGGYSMPPEQRKQPLRRPLATELDEMAAKHDISWRRNADGLVLVRNNRWYRDDDLEVPQPLLRRWFAMLLQSRQQEAAAQAATPLVVQTPEERAGAIKQTWDWAAEVSSTLTPWQIYNGLTLFQPEEKDLMAQNDASASRLFEPLKHRPLQPGEAMRPGFDPFTAATRRAPFGLATDLLKGFSHTVHLYGSLGDAGRTALLGGRLPADALNEAQLAGAASLTPTLPQALQNSLAASVLLGLVGRWTPSARVSFGATPPMDLKVVTPPAP